MEFEFRSDGKLRYANNSNYKKDSMIRKEGRGEDPCVSVVIVIALTPIALFLPLLCALVTVSQAVIEELKRIIQDSEITKYVSPL